MGECKMVTLRQKVQPLSWPQAADLSFPPIAQRSLIFPSSPRNQYVQNGWLEAESESNKIRHPEKAQVGGGGGKNDVLGGGARWHPEGHVQ